MVEFFDVLREEFISFFSLHALLKLINSGNYESLRTWDGITAALSPLIPIIVILEMLIAFAHKKFKGTVYKITFAIYIFNRIASRYISFGVVAFCIGIFSPWAIINASMTWYWLIYGYLIWEFSHFIYHYLGHKVRLFWCLHSTHHAPESMNLSVNYAHFILEAPYADFIRTSICIVAGVPPVMLFVIMFIDGTWGSFIHIGENVMKDARFGVVGKFILTPSHHRVHHARNPLYMDTNFCNLLNIWDRVFNTYQPEKDEINIEYGVTRKINAQNFFDVYFGELYYLWKDITSAPGVINKLRYIVMPPGWHHSGEHKTARVIRSEYLNNLRNS